MNRLFGLFALLCCVGVVHGEMILLEAESFPDRGGWVVDQQSMDVMGSPYLLAHGYGKPVTDASTTFQVAATDSFRVWVRTWNWVTPWNAKPAPGIFQLTINGQALPTIFGEHGRSWDWRDGGVIYLEQGEVTATLHDLTGFEGRCDAVLFTTDLLTKPPNTGTELAGFRKSLLGLPDVPPDAGEYDFVVIGGGMAGTAATIAAARLGVRVALIQNRPVLGGNNSSEIRVHALGETNLQPHPQIGDVINEIARKGGGNASPAETYQDDRKLLTVLAELNAEVFLNHHAFHVEKQGNRIVAVWAKDTRTGKELRFPAPLFADCTGDGTIGVLAGADFRYGREGRDETGESMAPQTADSMTLGTSVLWYAAERDTASEFPECPWALQFTEKSCLQTTKATWEWETGMNKNMITEFEQIRDYMFRAIYGNWAFLKNQAQNLQDYAEWELDWVAYIGGKRESRRLMGDVILTQQDIQERREFPDASFVTTWSIDLHYPQPEHNANFPEQPFLSYCEQPDIVPYAVPYRCLYSRNVDNLLMAGRNISVTHVALGTVRVMRTTGMMGEVIGMAASLCKKYDASPRDVYQQHLADLKDVMKKGVGK